MSRESADAKQRLEESQRQAKEVERSLEEAELAFQGALDSTGSASDILKQVGLCVADVAFNTVVPMVAMSTAARGGTTLSKALAGGASILNQFQSQENDAHLMESKLVREFRAHSYLFLPRLDPGCDLTHVHQ